MTARAPHPAAAVLAAVAGLAVSAGLPAIHVPRAAVNGLAPSLLVLGGTRVHTAIGAIGDARLTVHDPERTASVQPAFEVFAHHSITGAGPSLPTLTWVTGNGSSVYRYAHNEYVQVLAELGAVGGLLLAVMLLAIIRRLYQARRENEVIGAGALAATTALAIHAAFDFVWHIPGISLLAAALVGLASPRLPASTITQPIRERQGKETA
jgi:O-antigen ligase